MTYDLLDDLAGGVEVDQTLVDLELVTIPGLGTLTARLRTRILKIDVSHKCRPEDLQSYGW